MPDSTTIDAPTLKRMHQERTDVLLIDVRSATEFETAHIPGSHNVPLALLSRHPEVITPRLSAPAVLVCQSGTRAQQARQRLQSVGITNARVLTGGVPAFVEAGGELNRGRQTWDLERQVRLVAGSLVLTGMLGGQLVSPKLRLLAAGIGAGLTFSATTNTCAMGSALSRLPFNRSVKGPTAAQVLRRLP